MTIWVDADACPKVIKEILLRAAARTGVSVVFVAHQRFVAPKVAYVRVLHVEKGFDAADNEIVRQVQSGDLVVTEDIPLASSAIAKEAVVITTRGTLYTEQNISARLTMRDFLETLRASGIQTEGPNALSQTDRREFANQLDRYLVKANTKRSTQ